MSVRPCAFVYVCVSVIAFYLITFSTNLQKNRTDDLTKILGDTFQILIILLPWRNNGLIMLLPWHYNGHFVCFQIQHPHSRNCAQISFKFTNKEVKYLPIFAIENEQNQSISSGRKNELRLQKTHLSFQPVSKIPTLIINANKTFCLLR